MSGNYDYVANEVYGAHLRGDTQKFSNSNANTRTALIQRMYVRTLTELAANRFEWVNLPESIDERFLELSLFYRALAIFFKGSETGKPKNRGSKSDDNGFNESLDDFYVTRGGAQGSWDVADNPTTFQLFGNHFQGRTLSAIRTYKQGADGELVPNDAECVPIWANFLRVPDIDLIMIYATKFADIDVSIEINAHNARRGKIVAVDENQKLTAVHINNQIDKGETLIQIAPNAIGALPVALDLGIQPSTITELHILKVRLYNELMGYLGINNANQDKKERLVADEVDANNEQVSSTRNVALNARQAAAKLINARYNLNIEVRMRSDATTAKAEAQENGGEEIATPDKAEKPELKAV